MKFENIKEKVKEICKKIGKRNFIIFGALALVICAVAVNLVMLSRDGNGGFDYDSPAGMDNETEGNSGVNGGSDVEVDSYFSSVQVSRQRTRDEAIEVLQAVVDNQSSTEAARTEALAEINKLAAVMTTESNIETLIVAKGFEECVAVISGDTASIVVKSDGLNVAQISQINEIVYSESGIKPVNVTIIER